MVESGPIDTGTLTDGLETGTGVPRLIPSGIPSITSGPRLGDLGAVAGDSQSDLIADLSIPDYGVENCAEALV